MERMVSNVAVALSRRVGESLHVRLNSRYGHQPWVVGGLRRWGRISLPSPRAHASPVASVSEATPGASRRSETCPRRGRIAIPFLAHLLKSCRSGCETHDFLDDRFTYLPKRKKGPVASRDVDTREFPTIRGSRKRRKQPANLASHSQGHPNQHRRMLTGGQT